MAHNDAADGMTSEQPTYEYRAAWRLTADGTVITQDHSYGSLDYVRALAAGMLDFHRSQVVEAWIERRIVGPWEKVEL